MVRKRTDRKRQVILDAAYGLFRERGFERTLLSEICSRAGGSKSTIYSYFSSKEDLFVECMFSLAENYLEGILCDLQGSAEELSSVLQRFGESFLSLVCSPEMVSVRRLMIAEGGRAGIGKLFYGKLMGIRQQVALVISSAVAEGKLHASDSALAAGQFFALLEAELLAPLLLRASNAHPDEEAIASATRQAVETFLNAYALKISRGANGQKVREE